MPPVWTCRTPVSRRQQIWLPPWCLQGERLEAAALVGFGSARRAAAAAAQRCCPACDTAVPDAYACPTCVTTAAWIERPRPGGELHTGARLLSRLCQGLGLQSSCDRSAYGCIDSSASGCSALACCRCHCRRRRVSPSGQPGAKGKASTWMHCTCAQHGGKRH